MSGRAFFACVRREVQRGRRTMLLVSALGGAAALVALFAAPELGPLAIVLAMPAGMLALFGPSADLGEDKMQGHLEFDRVLPVAARTVAAGRLAGAALRLLPVALCALALAIAISRDAGGGELTQPLLVGLPLAVYLGAVLICWTMLALNARWQFRKLWWVPVTLVFGPQFVVSLLPPAVKAALADSLRALAQPLAALVRTPLGSLLALLFLIALPFLVFGGATLLFASGLERYRYDANVLGELMGKAPRRELGAAGRGPLLAVLRLRLRLATEQQRRQLVVLGILLVLVVVGTGELRDFARAYVRVLAALLPGGIALQLMAARSRGYLEGMQQLPHPARTIALGHLAAVVVMSGPGALVLLLTQALSGARPSLLGGLMLWGWLVSFAWVAAVLAVWLKPRHFVVILGVPIVAVAGLLIGLGAERLGGVLSGSVGAVRALRDSAGAALPFGVMGLLAALGVPCFARGVETYVWRPR